MPISEQLQPRCFAPCNLVLPGSGSRIRLLKMHTVHKFGQQMLSKRQRSVALARAQSEHNTPRGVTMDDAAQPWKFGFQMNERYLNWDKAAHLQLLKMACAKKLNLGVKDVEDRVMELAALVPDLMTKLGTMKADIMIALLEDTEKLAERLSELREIMPSTNISKLVSSSPSLVLDFEPADLAQRLDNLRHSFGERTDIEFLVAREPNLLRFAKSREAVQKLLADVERLLPVKDALGFVISNPGLVLDMEASNLPSAMDGDLTQDP